MTPTNAASDSAGAAPPPKIPPRWIIRSAWRVHRLIYRLSRGRLGLRLPTADTYGMMALRTTGRRSGEQRLAIVAYIVDGDAVVTMAMNGWDQPAPAWWLNLQAEPRASIRLPGESLPRAVRAREASGAEHERLWTAFQAVEDDNADLDALARLRGRPTPLVILDPVPSAAD